MACPGCGLENNRKKESVCPECLGRLEFARRIEKQYEELKGDPEMIECQVPFSWEGPSFSTFRTNQHNESLKPVAELLVKLSRLCAVPAGMQTTWGYMAHLCNHRAYEPKGGNRSLPVVFIKEAKPGRKNGWHDQGAAVMPKHIYNALTDLIAAINTALAATEEGALEFGKNALFMLNSGKISIEDFNEL